LNIASLASDAGISQPTAGKSDVSKFDVLDKISGVVRGAGGVVCLYDNLVTLKGNDKTIPVSIL